MLAFRIAAWEDEIMNNRYVILGASRGLGWAFYQNKFAAEPNSEFLLVSRKINESHRSDHQHVQICKNDFSVTPVSSNFLKVLKEFSPTYIVYCAGGGPYGHFENKKWSDHTWAINVNFMFPAELLHLISNDPESYRNLKSITFIGSKIAESNPDARAASYAAAKHALKGLVTTVQLESTLPFKVKLFSPGYILTDLLPLNSAPRIENKALTVDIVASQLVQFIDSNNDVG
jgi:short-subunit dehydrogenase